MLSPKIRLNRFSDDKKKKKELEINKNKVFRKRSNVWKLTHFLPWVKAKFTRDI